MATTVQAGTAVGYFRVSSPGQAGERHVSLEVQAAAFRDDCQRHSRTPLAVFTDVASGRKDDRPEYRRMLDYVAQNDVDTVVVLFLDRFGRNPREILRRYWQLEERGVAVHSINEDLREELMLLLRAGIAGQESRRTSERVVMALREAAKRGKLVSKLPFGYVKIRDQDGEHIEQVPEEAAAIRLAYEQATDRNMGFKAVADELNRRGYRTKGGRLFAAQSVRLLLLNPAMVGRAVFKGQGEAIINEAAYPAILSPEEWDKLQQRLSIRREGKHRGAIGASVYLLSGTLRCGHCGAAMAANNKGSRRYYSCTGRRMAQELCPLGGRYHRQERLETAVLEYLGQYADPNVVRELLEAQELEVDTRAEEELTTVSARLAHLEQAFLNDLDRVDREVMTEAEYLKRQEVRRGEQEGLQARKIELESAIAAQRDMEVQVAAVPIKVQTFLEDFQEMDVREAKAILQGIIKAAHVFSDGRIELEFRG